MKQKAYLYLTSKSANGAGYTTQQWLRSRASARGWNTRRINNRIIKETTQRRSNLVDAYQVITKTSVNTRGTGSRGKFNTYFRYEAEGYFENKPKASSLDTMTKNSIIKAFNSGKAKGRYLQRNLFGALVENGVRGFEIRPVKVAQSKLTNQLKLKLSINNNGFEWNGEN